MAWGIIISFATLFGTLILVLADAMEVNEPDASFDEGMKDDKEEPVREAV
jgi:hypothetical protein